MSFRFRCPGCQSVLKTAATSGKIKCPKCAHVFAIAGPAPVQAVQAVQALEPVPQLPQQYQPQPQQVHHYHAAPAAEGYGCLSSIGCVVVALVAIVGIAVVIGVMNPGLVSKIRGRAPMTEEEKAKDKDEQNFGGLALVRDSVRGVNQEFGGEITGTVINRKTRTMAYVQITFNLYDASGAQIGTALANVNGLEAGGRWNFRAVALRQFDRYKVSGITGW